MKLLKLYSWMAGSMSDFAKPFKENENLYKQATAFWNKLENSSTVILLICLVLGIAIAAFYYTSYNNRPGRHYTPKFWALMLVITFALTFGATFGFEYLSVKPTLQGATMLEIKIALCNSLYAVFVYFLTSVVWCKWLPTNAYRLFKF